MTHHLPISGFDAHHREHPERALIAAIIHRAIEDVFLKQNSSLSTSDCADVVAEDAIHFLFMSPVCEKYLALLGIDWDVFRAGLVKYFKASKRGNTKSSATRRLRMAIKKYPGLMDWAIHTGEAA